MHFLSLAAFASAAPLQAFYKFDDSSNLGKNSVLNAPSSTNLVTSPNGAVFEANGKTGGAVLFDSNSDGALTQSAEFPAGVPIGDSSFSVSVFYKISTVAAAVGAKNPYYYSDLGLIGWGNPISSELNVLRTTGCSGFTSTHWNNDLEAFVIDPQLNHCDEQWHHVILSYSTTTKTTVIIVDGIYKVGKRFEVPFDVKPVNFAIGRGYSTEFFDGLIDEVLL